MTVLAGSWLLLSCANSPAPGIEAAAKHTSVSAQPNFAMDSTVGSYGTGRDEKLILVTIDSDAHRRLISPQDTSSTGALPERYEKLMARWSRQYGINRVADWPVPALQVSCLIFEITGSSTRDQIVALMNQLPIVDTAQPVQTFNTEQDVQYNDPYLSLQHALRSTGADFTHRWTTGRNVTIAVADTGIDVLHPDLAGRVIEPMNFVDIDQQQFQDDVHGTAVAGVIAATAGNLTGMVGIAPQAIILPMKACWQLGDNGSEGASCNSITLLKALDNAIEKQVDIINLSLAGPRDPLLEQLVAIALQRNIVVIAARSASGDAGFAAAVEGVIAVSDQRNPISGDITAPGQQVLSLHPDNQYEFYDGSSFSAAHVAGIVALIRELAPDWSPARIDALIRSTADLETGSANACRAISSIIKADASVCDTGDTTTQP